VHDRFEAGGRVSPRCGPGTGWIVRRVVVCLLAATALLAWGCGTGDDRAAARATTDRFYAAIRAGDGTAACEQLSADTRAALESDRGQPCEETITGLQYEGGRIAGVEVYTTNAFVTLSSGEHDFLSVERGRWVLDGVACQAEHGKPRDRPFECEASA
jgi:hypothetical protein